VSLAFMDQIFTLLFNAESHVRQASQPRLAIEMVFFKIHQITPALPIDLLIERLDSLLDHRSLNASPAGIVEAQTGFGQAPVLPIAPSSDNAMDTSMAATTSVGADPVAIPDPRGAQSPQPMGDEVGDADAWGRVIAQIRESKPSIAAALSRAQLISDSPKEFVVAIHDNEYTINLIKKNLGLVEAVCRRHADRRIQIDFTGDKKDDAKTVSAKQRADDLRQQLLNHPLVSDAVDIFSGKIEDIKIR
jgi:DNA polymerase-3 subunit gamma/tau